MSISLNSDNNISKKKKKTKKAIADQNIATIELKETQKQIIKHFNAINKYLYVSMISFLDMVDKIEIYKYIRINIFNKILSKKINLHEMCLELLNSLNEYLKEYSKEYNLEDKYNMFYNKRLTFYAELRRIIRNEPKHYEILMDTIYNEKTESFMKCFYEDDSIIPPIIINDINII